MSAADELVFRPLKDEEIPLAEGLVAIAPVEDEKSECWGVKSGEMPVGAGEAWGVFIRGSLGGVLWFRDPLNGVAEISALVLPRKRWSMGLMVWMTGEIAKEAKKRGAGELAVRLERCGQTLADEMEYAQFTGPDPKEENYPCGEWRREL